MSDLRRDTQPRLHKQQSLRETCSEVAYAALELKKFGNGKLTNGHGGTRNPLLHALSDHANLSSASTGGGSTTSSTPTTATAAAAASAGVGRSGSNNFNGGANTMNGSRGELQFDEHEIYYVSPSKRKSGNTNTAGGNTLRSSMRGLRSFSPTTVAPSYSSIRPATAYEQNFDSFEHASHYSDTAMQMLRSGSCAGVGGIIGSNNLATAAGTGSSSSSSLTAARTHQNNVVTFSNYVCEQRATPPTPTPAPAPAAQHRGSLKRNKGRSNQSLCSCDVGDDADINPDPTRPLYEYSLERRRKTHTYTCEQNAQILMRLERERNRKLSLTSGAVSVGANANANASASNNTSGTTSASHIRRSASKDDVQCDTSSSCTEMDIIPPVPPPPAMKRNGSMRSLRLLQYQQMQHQQCRTSSNTAGSNTLATLCSSDLLQDCTKSALDIGGVIIDDCTTSILKCASNTAATLMPDAADNVAANGTAATAMDDMDAGLAKGNIKVAKSSITMLPPTTTLSANAKPDVCQHQQQQKLQQLLLQHKQQQQQQQQQQQTSKCFPPPFMTDDIYTPHTQKSDPSLCFLHTGPNGIGAGPDLTKSQRDLQHTSAATRTASMTPTSATSQAATRNLFSLSKYNTIGPSSDYARHLAHYSRYLLQQHQQQQLQHMQQQRCRCFSQSLSSFPRDYFGQSSGLAAGSALRSSSVGRDKHTSSNNNNNNKQKQHIIGSGTGGTGGTGGGSNNNIFHTGDEHDWINGNYIGYNDTDNYNDNGSMALLPINSRSYSNLVDIVDGRHTIGSRLPYQKFHTPAIGGSTNLTGAASTYTMTSFDGSTNSGLKDKFQQYETHHHHHQHQQQHEHDQQQQEQLAALALAHNQHQHTHHHQQQQQHHHHQHQHHHQHHTVGMQQDGSNINAGGIVPQKHHQLHSSVTSIMPWKHRQCPSRGSSSSGTNSFRFDAAKHWLAVSSILLIIGAASVAVPLALRVAASAPFEERLRVAVQLLDQVPLIDGHNDLPWNIRKFLHNKLNDFNFHEDLRNVMPWARSHWSHTDLHRLKKGRISAQFWAAYVPCEAQHRDAVQLTLEQIDVIKRLTDRYSPQLTTCTSAQDIIEAHKNHQLCSLTGVEGGHSLGGSLAVLRTLYAIGVRYMTLTSTCHTPWADSSYADAPTFNMKHGGLTIFGKTIIREMNRLGMMVDLSHVSKGTMRDALEVSEAPVIFSHSSAYELCNTSRNVQDDILQSLAKNGGLVMVNFYSKFLSCSENSTVHDAVAHINHIKRVAGIDHVGLGAGYDGINYTPKGLEDVSSYPTLFAELLGAGWSIEDLTKLAGGNFLRVMQQVEKIRDDKKSAGVKPYEDHPNFRTDDPYNCTSS